MAKKFKKYNLSTGIYDHLLFWGLISQKKSHELVLPLSDVLCLSFTKSNTSEYQAYFCMQNDVYYFLVKNTSNSVFTPYSVDYVFAIANYSGDISLLKKALKKIQEDSFLLGFYELHLKPKENTHAIALLDLLMQ